LPNLGLSPTISPISLRNDTSVPCTRRGAKRAGRHDALCYALIAHSGVRLGGSGTARVVGGFRLPGLPPATTEAPAAEETPVHEEAPMTEATPGISGCSRCGHTHSRYPGHTQNLGSHGSQGVCEDDGDNRQAPDKDRSDLFHGLHHCEGLLTRQGGVRKPIERSYPSINRLLQKHIYPQRGIIPPRRPTASGDPVRRPWRLLVRFVGDQVQRTSRLQAISANVLGRIEKRHGDDDGAPPLAP